METAAHPRFLFKPRTLGTTFVTLTSSASLRTGVVKTFRCATEVQLPSNPYEPPKTEAVSSDSPGRSAILRRAAAFSFCLLTGVITSQIIAYLSAPNAWPDGALYLGMFGVILGVFGGFLANLLCVNQIPWYYIVAGLGVVSVVLALNQSPNYSAVARQIAAIGFAQMFASLSIGFLAR